MDNAYLFFASNPRVTLQLKNAFEEKSLTLDSIKSVENISLNFQNLIYTDGYLEEYLRLTIKMTTAGFRSLEFKVNFFSA